MGGERAFAALAIKHYREIESRHLKSLKVGLFFYIVAWLLGAQNEDNG
jgi:hypothetical protein